MAVRFRRRRDDGVNCVGRFRAAASGRERTQARCLVCLDVCVCPSVCQLLLIRWVDVTLYSPPASMEFKGPNGYFDILFP